VQGGAHIAPQLDRVIREQLDRLPKGLRPRLPPTERIVFIDNPCSGGGTFAHYAHSALQLYRFLGYQADLVRTESPRHGTELAEQAAAGGATLVIACSGDGGVREVISGLMRVQSEQRPKFSIIPKGTANVLAKTVGLQIGPIPDLFHACLKQLYWARTQPMDVGMLNGEAFACFVGFGFDAAVIERVPPTQKKIFKEWAFVGAALRTFFGWDPDTWSFTPFEAPRLRVRGTDEHGQAVDLEAYFVAIGNVQDYGTRWFPFIRGATLDDGLLDVILVQTNDTKELLHIGRQVVTKTHLENPHVRSFRSRQPIHVEGVDGAVPVHADSELVGRLQHTVIELQPGGLDVLH
jgi:diacylglycerol kinase family enzyme